MSGLKPQHLAIGVVAVLAAFGVAFGAGKATGGSDSKSSTTKSGTVEKVDTSKGGLDVASLDTGGLPGLKKKKSSGGGGGGSSSTGGSSSSGGSSGGSTGGNTGGNTDGNTPQT